MRYKIRVNTNKCDKFVLYCYKHNINIYNIKYYDEYLICDIDKDNYKKLYMYDRKIIDGDKRLIYIIRKNIGNIFVFIMGLIMFFILSNIIVDVNINIDNNELYKLVNKELDNNGIRRLSMKKSYDKLQEIKHIISSKLGDYVEWLEIENVGMTYNIKLEPRKKVPININYNKCDVVAEKDGIVRRIISDNGVVLVDVNDYVKEGDILITGDIILNDEVKNSVCASGIVYAEKWYSVIIELPKKVLNKKYTGKVRYNILYEDNNKDYLIFKDRISKYDTNKEVLISLLGKKLYLVKEYEYINIYEDIDLDKVLDEVLIDKLDIKLKDKEKILYKNVLKKDENNSRIRVELFISVEESISKQVTY